MNVPERNPLVSNRLLNAAEHLPRAVLIPGLVGVTALLGVGDYLTGAFVAFTALYLAPVALGAWFGRRQLGIVIALLAASISLASELMTRHEQLSLVTLMWNFVAQLLVFSLTAILVHTLRLALVEERNALVAAHDRALQTQRQLEHSQRLSTVGKLAAGVAHELGTPLNVVGAYAQLIEEDGISHHEAAHIIREQTESMTRIVRQLVDFARAGKPRRSEHDVRDVISASLTMLKPMARKKEIELSGDAGEPLVAEVDAAQLQQVLSNLVVNAIHASPARGHVKVEAHRRTTSPPPDIGGEPRDMVVIRVQDDGRGIPPEIAAHLFEPFFTTKSVGEGAGLGLAVAYGMVREHQGWMSAENTPGAGACFTVCLPVS